MRCRQAALVAVALALALAMVAVAGAGLQEPPDLSGRWMLDPAALVPRNTPRPPVCGRECLIVQQGRSVAVTLQGDTTRFSGDGTPSTSSYRSPQGYGSDRTVTSRWEGAVLVIRSVSVSPETGDSARSVVRLSLVDGKLTIEGTRPLITGEDSFRFVYRHCRVEPPKPCR
jgi:hypothetical protein